MTWFKTSSVLFKVLCYKATRSFYIRYLVVLKIWYNDLNEQTSFTLEKFQQVQKRCLSKVQKFNRGFCKQSCLGKRISCQSWNSGMNLTLFIEKVISRTFLFGVFLRVQFVYPRPESTSFSRYQRYPNTNFEEFPTCSYPCLSWMSLATALRTYSSQIKETEEC